MNTHLDQSECSRLIRDTRPEPYRVPPGEILGIAVCALLLGLLAGIIFIGVLAL